MSIPTLRTARLTLRPFTAADGPRVKVLAGDRLVADTTGSIAHPYEDGMAEAWISKHAAAFEAGREVQWAITRSEGDELLGAIGLMAAQPHRRAELGYWLGVPYWGHGYASEAAEAAVRYGFSEMDLARITAQIFPRNPASAHILQKLGMRQEGVLRRHYLKWDVLEDAVLYGLLREEWEVASGQAVTQPVVPR